MRQLHELRISVELGHQDDELGHYTTYHGDGPIFDDRLEMAAEFFAERLAPLRYISFSRANHHNLYHLQRHAVWHRFEIFDCDGGQPTVKFHSFI
jgi:hypothetical protein